MAIGALTRLDVVGAPRQVADFPAHTRSCSRVSTMNSPLVVYTLFACAIGHFHAAPQDPGGDASLEDSELC